MKDRNPQATPDEKIVHYAKEWRKCDKEKMGDRDDRKISSAEFIARQRLRNAIDGAQP